MSRTKETPKDDIKFLDNSRRKNLKERKKLVDRIITALEELPNGSNGFSRLEAILGQSLGKVEIMHTTDNYIRKKQGLAKKKYREIS